MRAPYVAVVAVERRTPRPWVPGFGPRVVSCEVRANHAEHAERNVRQFFGELPAHRSLRMDDLAAVAALAERSPAESFDHAVLDVLAPWEHLDTVATALVPGGVLVGYVATTTQLTGWWRICAPSSSGRRLRHGRPSCARGTRWATACARNTGCRSTPRSV
jgi:hypothetical protein